MNRKVVKVNKHVVEIPEQSPWDSGFSIFKRRIGELMQLSGNDDSVIDDDDLIPYYRMGERVLSPRTSFRHRLTQFYFAL